MKERFSNFCWGCYSLKISMWINETSFVAPALKLSELASVLSLVTYPKKKNLWKLQSFEP